MQIWINKGNFILDPKRTKVLAGFCGRPMSQVYNWPHVRVNKIGGRDETVVIFQRPSMTQFGQQASSPILYWKQWVATLNPQAGDIHHKQSGSGSSIVYGVTRCAASSVTEYINLGADAWI